MAYNQFNVRTYKPVQKYRAAYERFKIDVEKDKARLERMSVPDCAAAYGVSDSVMGYWRIGFKVSGPNQTTVDWWQVDWADSDEEIAAQLGISLKKVSLGRARYTSQAAVAASKGIKPDEPKEPTERGTCLRARTCPQAEVCLFARKGRKGEDFLGRKRSAGCPDFEWRPRQVMAKFEPDPMVVETAERSAAIRKMIYSGEVD